MGLAGLVLASHPAAALAAAAPAAAAPAAPAPAATTVAANLNISPKRLTFDRAGRSATVFIFNQGGAPGTFDVSLVDRVMLPDGQITPIADAATKPELSALVARARSAKEMITITPRRATLQPGKGQTIRIRVAADPNATTGEFRSHLTVTTIPPANIGLTAEQAAANTPEQLQFVINSVFGLSIPVIVRTGPADVRAGIENAKLSYAELSPDGVAPPKRTPVVDFELVRLGANSLFGNIEVRSTRGRGDPLGVARGVGVYTEIERRTMRIPLNRAPTPGEQLEISFSDDDTAPGTVLAKGALGP
jgi:P pilus assembly chaperone PapD